MESILFSKLYRQRVATYGRCLSVHNGVAPRCNVLSLSQNVVASRWSLWSICSYTSYWVIMLILDSVTDVGNFAALIRSAAAFGVHAIVIPRHEAVSLTPAVAKLSAGAIERMSIVRVANVVRALDELKQHGFWVYGADMQ